MMQRIGSIRLIHDAFKLNPASQKQNMGPMPNCKMDDVRTLNELINWIFIYSKLTASQKQRQCGASMAIIYEWSHLFKEVALFRCFRARTIANLTHVIIWLGFLWDITMADGFISYIKLGFLTLYTLVP